MTFEELVEKIKQSGANTNLDLVNKAYQFALLAYGDAKRLSGQTFIEHNLAVAETLIGLRIYDAEVIAAALLHSVLKDTPATMADLTENFGSDLANLINTLEQLSTVKLYHSQEQKYVENLRKLFLVAAKDMRVVLIRLADRLDNLKTLEFLEESKRRRIAEETLEIFAPLAARLGIGELKGSLEDLAFPYVYPDEFYWTVQLSKPYYKQLEKLIAKVKAKLRVALKEAGIDADVHGRAKHLYSLYKKLKRPEIDGDISKIYDLMAVRVIVGTVEECYKALGVVHKLWRPLPNYVRDYIALPKPNGYRSIHTTVFGPQGRLFEVQIRDWQMHYEAEFGIAAHWYYAEQKNRSTDSQVQAGFAVSDKLQWVKQLTAWQKDVTSSEEFLRSLKIDFFKDRIFALTPKGDVKDLPAGATPVDFAYSVHTDLGNKCIGAKVNGKMVALDYQLKSGDVVEILVSKDPAKKPSRDWLDFVVTSVAKREIRRHAG